ncbi:TPA: VOC family protein [Providencia stuartii]|uniref:Metallothiol transferase n=1 Tax=Providencia stuartii (strain MRSN 2154) TaxID=1157951 RepID=A0A140NIZ1_PROSM|nr:MULTISPECIES: VOC family protein [Providencia]AFH92618.1 metallothiol transferase [Providencia stuartii MRSN 2154]EMF0918140.1 VOC family protein [Providencia stuartii]MBN5559856.1 VOC family protein [Providencia stuartii]MBN5599832.1 VOC family protein [Providencia stuartii]MBN5603350.1 VOC family protein [Providencia stuartii]
MINHLDHLVLTTTDQNACIDFYTHVLKMKLITFGEQRYALQFGQQKINIHQYGKEFEPKAHLPVPGSLDLCFISNTPINQIMTFIQQQGVEIIEGPVKRTGAMGEILSIYIRDPDLNLIEIANYI